MKLINQLGIISLFWILGEGISLILSSFINVPGAIIGMLLMALALTFGILKESQIKEAGDLLLGNISFFFVPVSVGIIAFNSLSGAMLAKIILIAVISTGVTMFVTMWTTNLLLGKRKERHDESID